MEKAKLNLTTIVSQPYAENTYVACLEGRDDCLVIDPGLEPDKILSHLDANGLTPAAILCTHGHPDHIGGNAALKGRWPECPLVFGKGAASFMARATRAMGTMLGGGVESPPPELQLGDGEVYSAAGFDLEVRETPGHAPDHVVFVWMTDKRPYVFGGDVLFRGSIGRTDFPGCSFEQLSNSIEQKLFTLPDETIVLPGHGPPTTIGDEKRSNPFVGAASG